METDDITYNQASGKLYQSGVPLLNQTFRDEVEAEDYLKKAGLKLHKTGQSNLLSPLQTKPQSNPGRT